MLGKLETRKQEAIDAIIRLARERLSPGQSAALEAFVRLFYAHVPPDDILERETEDLLGAALSTWSFIAQRPAGTPKVRAFSPTFEAHGWHSLHSAIEIVNDDMPFLVDSVTAELARQGMTVHLVIHPIARIRRDAKGKLIELLPPDAVSADGTLESIMHIEASEQSDLAALEQIEERLTGVLADVRAAVEDWRKMRAAVLAEVESIEKAPPANLAADELAEACAFLRWMEADHFTFLGYREYAYKIGRASWRERG